MPGMIQLSDCVNHEKNSDRCTQASLFDIDHGSNSKRFLEEHSKLFSNFG